MMTLHEYILDVMTSEIKKQAYSKVVKILDQKYGISFTNKLIWDIDYVDFDYVMEKNDI